MANGSHIVNPGRTIVLYSGSLTGSTVEVVDFVLQADLLLLSVYVRSVTGSVSVAVDTYGMPGEDVQVAMLGPFVAPTADIQFTVANPTLANHRVRIIHSGACDIQVTAKGISNSPPVNDDGSIDVTIVAGGGGGGGGNFAAATIPVIVTLPMAAANTEYLYPMPANVKKFKLHNRDNGLLKLSYVTGFSTTYWTIFPGQQFGEDLILKTGLVLYLQSTSAAQTVEITAWS